MGKHEQHGGMGKRGVTRPMPLMEGMHGGDEEEEHREEHEEHDEHGGDGHGGHHMSEEDRRQMLHMHHKQTLWVPWAIVALGAWMVLAPATFGYGGELAEPSGGRGVWLSDRWRVLAMMWSDILSGLGLIYFGGRALKPNRPVSLWICCFIGIWLNFAPLIFWCPQAWSYLNSTLVGAFVIALAILIPGMPNMIMYMRMGGDVPPGWSYTPSSWPQRWIMIVPCFFGWMVSRYLAAFQLGYIDEIWEPFFGEGSRRVLNSDMSHMWPISDGGLGAFSYTLEFLMGFMGSSSRWRTMPWMVAFFGVLVIPLGVTHIALVMSQPVVVGYWCTMCLLAAAIMLPMIAIEVDEVMAMLQHMFDSKRRGEPLWRVFWKGGSPEGSTQEERQPAISEFPERPLAVAKASVWGISLPWNLMATIALGIWLLFAPAVFGTTQPASAIAHIGGAAVIVVAGICTAEVVRIGRWLNVPVGLGIAILPWILGDAPMAARINELIVGLAIAALAIPRGPKTQSYGMWEKWVR